MIQLMPKKKEERKERRLAFIFCCFHYKRPKDLKIVFIAGWNFSDSFQFLSMPQLKFSCFPWGEEVLGVCGMEDKIKNSIDLSFRSLAFCLCLAKHKRNFFAIATASGREKEFFQANLTGTIVRSVEKYKKLKYQHGIYFIINPLFGVIECDN